MFLLVLANPGCPGQNPESRKMVVCVKYLSSDDVRVQQKTEHFGSVATFIGSTASGSASKTTIDSLITDSNKTKSIDLNVSQTHG